MDTPHVDRILAGHKTWELRTSATTKRGRVALIRKGSGTVVGTVEVVDSIGPLTQSEMLDNTSRHLVTPERISAGDVSKYKYAWVLRNAHILSRPIPYEHPKGAVIWVNLDPTVAAQIA